LGGIVQKRLVRRLDLELLLSQVDLHPYPSSALEQYMTPTDVAATMLHLAAYTNDDIVGKRVLDLGCGTGRLALGAAFLGAKQVVGVDLDRTSVRLASENAAKTGLGMKAQWIAADISAIRGRFDTVLQNPPFGVQKRNADRRFLEKAMEVGRTIYSIHKSAGTQRSIHSRLKPSSREDLISVSPSPFLENFVQERGGKIKAVYAMIMTIPHMFDFHSKKKHEFVVDLYVIEERTR
jgi:putative methylase